MGFPTECLAGNFVPRTFCLYEGRSAFQLFFQSSVPDENLRHCFTNEPSSNAESSDSEWEMPDDEDSVCQRNVFDDIIND